jgi:hypothetical protein
MVVMKQGNACGAKIVAACIVLPSLKETLTKLRFGGIMLTEFKLNLIAPHTMQGAAMGSRMRENLKKKSIKIVDGSKGGASSNAWHVPG